jgi:hypothetical protein
MTSKLAAVLPEAVVILLVAIFCSLLMLPRVKDQEFIRNIEKDLNIYIDRVQVLSRSVEDLIRMNIVLGVNAMLIPRVGNSERQMLEELVTEVQRMSSELEKLTKEVRGISQLMAEQGEIV